MPEFVMPIGEAQKDWGILGEFERGYIEAMFFTADEELGGISFADMPRETVVKILDDCGLFQDTAEELLGWAYGRDYTPGQAGRDFWFTRNGHGVGFWDRDVLEKYGLGELLSQEARGFGETDLYRGDDGKVYLS